MDLIVQLVADKQSTARQKVDKCEKWLSENHGHVEAHLIENYRDTLASTMYYMEEKLASTEGELASEKEKLKSLLLVSVKKEFPYLRDRTISGPHFPDKHKHADVVQIPVDHQPSIVKETMENPDFWDVPFVPVSGKDGDCDSELNSQTHVVQLLIAVLQGLHLSKLVGVIRNRTLAGIECDILLMYKPNRLPFAAVEVKKPGNSIEFRRQIWTGKPKTTVAVAGDEDGTEKGENCVAGQVFDEMRAVQLFGFQTVSGMISTGNQWRVVGLLDTYDERNSVEAALKNLKGRHKALLSNNQRTSGEQIQADHDMTVDEVTIDGVSPKQTRAELLQEYGHATEAERKIWGGEIVPLHQEEMASEQLYRKVQASGTEIVAQVIVFILKACDDLFAFLESQEHDDPLSTIRIRPKMSCRILKNVQRGVQEKRPDDVFAFGTISVGQVNLDSFKPKLHTIYVIHHLGMGDFGNVCLGISSTGGSSCAIKFYHENRSPTREEAANQECYNWSLIYGEERRIPKPFVLNITGGPCLVMPYLRPLRKAERHDLLQNGAIERALTTFAKSGYVHCDIKWRHFGRWKLDEKDYEENNNIFLLDLGKIKKARNKTDIESWISAMIERLEKRAGERSSTEDAKTPDQNPSKKIKLETKRD